MALKLFLIAASLACANAGLIGAPVATYSAAPAVSSAYFNQATPALAVAHAAPVAVAHAAPLAIHSPSIGASHQSVLRSLGGAQAVSHYSKAVDSAFSSVRKFDTRVTNDALTFAHAPVAAYAAHAPVATYAAPAQIATYAAHAPVATYAAHAPVATYAAHAPVATYAAHAPVVKAAALSYSPAAVVSHVSFSGLGASYAW